MMISLYTIRLHLVTGEIGGAYYGSNHPMKPHRICMTHHLVLGYGLHKHMEVFVSHKFRTVLGKKSFALICAFLLNCNLQSRGVSLLAPQCERDSRTYQK